MLTALNNYAHGYVAIPVILACKKHGLFKILNSDKPFPFTDLVKELQANSGHLRAALHMLESLNWVYRNNKDEYLLIPESDIHRKIPDDIMNLMSFPMNDYLNKNQKKHKLGKWIELSSRRWDIGNSMVANFLDGMLVIPLLLALKENGLLSSSDNQKSPLFSRLNPTAREEIIEFFIDQGWLSQEKGVAIFTDSGRFIAQRIFITATVASYRPMLSNIAEVIFGDCKSVFRPDLSDQELHVERTLNVIGSGFQHEKYFSDMEEIILCIFNRKPFEEQPKYIADMGCGDGTLLKKIYEIIKNKSLRGKFLSKHPVKLIGMDFNEKALEETTHTLKDIDHIVLKGDIGDPEQMIVDLKNIGIQDVENILHVRSFMDHARPYITPSDTFAKKARSSIPCEAVYVDREGNALSATSVMQSLVEHLERWSKVLSKHGLILLEEHCLEPKTVNQFIDKCESLHFDAYHRFSQQLLIEADRFLMAAAEAGLFPNQNFFRKYPKTLPLSRITLNHFERREYRVRYAQEIDLPALEQLENHCWEPGLRTPDFALKKRLQQYPEGQLVLELDNQVVGAIYSQIIVESEDLKKASSETVARLHRKEGSVVQLLAINILPEVQHRNLGDQLLEFMLQRCSLMNGVHSVVAVTKCKDYHKHAYITPQEYISLRNEQGRLVDTVLRFHELHGAQVKGLVPNYRLQDKKNEGYGVLVEYNVYNRQRNDIQVNSRYLGKAVKAGTTEKIKSIKNFIVKTIISILGKTKEEDDFSLEQPLMEMGLNSADLLELNEQISYKYQILLEPAFFFVYNTAELIISYLQEHVRLEEEGDFTKIQDITVRKQSEQKDHSKKDETETVIGSAFMQKKDIAIVGVACRLPGGIRNKEQLWELLTSGKDAIGKMPFQRWNWPNNIDPDNEHIGIDLGGFLDEIAFFDAAFFRMSPKEAELTDPQQRMLLELSWECLEDAGYPAKALFDSKTGVFIGASGSDYNRLLDRHLEEIEAHYGIGTSMAVLPNRISYFYDFHGPSMQIDTACSSSLAAVHEAAKSLQGGECEQALVGGINIMCHPSNSIAYYKAGMLAKDGKCKTFDKEANGYVRGEGAVMILLKPLEQALRAQDSIYAVIKGTAINHGGQSSGLTVPNPEKQASLLMEAYRTADINPETVGYIEAHGTGTSLGDPVEISGLKEAFSQLSKSKGEIQKPYCGLGSIKTNIGHLEAAAGIAGLLKVVLSMRHQTLPASLNFNKLNPHITLSKTPFYIVNKNQPWQLPDGQFLRRAGVSSFGSGGANAHVVLEEAPVVTRPSNRELLCYLICLSAKTEEALQQREQDLALWLEKQGLQNNLADVSATLLLGRDHFGIRAAYVVRDVQELQEKLKEVLEKGQAEGYFRENSAKKGKQRQPLFEELGQAILKELHRGEKISEQGYANKLMALAELYVKGYELDWKAMYADNRIPRISLPTYPFAKEFYWVPEIETKPSGTTSSAIAASIHPLLHQNTSDLSEQRFSSIFTGQEFYLADHVVKGQRVLPGVAYLEMARAAVVQAAGALEKGQTGIRLKNVVWARPIVVREHPVQVHIGLYLEDNGEIFYEIYSNSEADNGEPVVHSQGSAVLSSAIKISTLDLKTLQAQCSQSSLSSTQCYEAFKAMGLEYGPGHQGIEKVYVRTGQVLAKLSLPSSVSDTQQQYVLHPTMMDSALQASIGLIMNSGDMGPSGSKASHKPALPFALQEIEILGNCTATMWALIRYSDVNVAGDKVEKLDIDLCDAQGNVWVRMKGVSLRVLEGEIQTGNISNAVPSEASSKPLVGTIMQTSVWDSIPVEKGQTFPSPADRVVIVGGTKDKRSAIQQHYPKARILEIQSEDTIDLIAKKMEAHGSIDHILWIAPHNPLKSLANDALIEEQNQGVLQVFRMIKALLRLGYETRDLGWSVITIQAQPIHKNDSVNPTHASLHGLIGSMAKEYPNWKVRLIDLEAGCDWPINDIFTLPPDTQGNAWGYRGQEWYWQKLVLVHRPPLDQTLYKPGGVYVVIGGAGGLGEAWSEYMINTYQARIIWIGRREKDTAIQAKLDRLATLGPAPLYITANATDRKALQQAYEEIKQRYSQIHGVIHSAIVLLDQSLANMDEERFRAGLSAKVDVSVRMAQVFQKEPLDFVMFFSSIVAFTKAPGQSNYASGCTFKDAFAHQLSQKWPCAVKVMNWGYWGSVGIVASKAYQNRMAQAGIGSIEPPEAMEALETLLAGPMNQIALIKITKPWAMDGINPEELIAVYSENIPSYIQHMQNHIPEQGSKIERMKSEGSQQMKEMDELLYQLLWGQLQSIGLFTEKNPVIADLKTKTGLRDLYDKWLKESITVLARKSYLRYDGESCTVIDTTPIDIEAVWKEWNLKKGSWMEDPNIKTWVVLTETTLRALPEILAGKRLATDVMFPNSSMELVEGIYKNNIVADYFNEVLADTIVTYIQERLKQDSLVRIRILEIGAGTGGTSVMVFQKLKPYQEHIQEYCYTDISKAFLMYAEKEYGFQNPYLTYKIFNVEEPIAGQGISAGGYDIVIAANVLHATKNIRQTLRNTKAVLQKNGLILLNEISSNALFLHLTFGLLEGWWLYEDTKLRIPGCPGLSPETWQSVLENEGFRSVYYPAKEAHELGQQIIVGESDGIVRQQQEIKPSVTPVEKRIMTKVSRSRVSNNIPQLSISHDKYLTLQKTKLIHSGANVTDQMIEDHLRTIIRESIAEALKMEEGRIQDNRSFSEYGVDSIIAVNLVNLINKQCHIRLQTTVLFDYNTVDQLARHVIQEHKSTLISLLQDNMPALEEVSQKKQNHTYDSINRRWQRNRLVVKSKQDSLIVENQPTYHRVIIGRPGGIDDLRVIESSVPELKEDEVRVAVRAFSLNFGDLLCIKGLYPTMPPYPFTPGFEASGIVVDVGSTVTSVHRGDAVIVGMGEALGGQASIITCSADQVFQKPKSLSFEEACSLPVVAVTMIAAFRKALLKRGEKILIQTAAGGTGLIAVQLAQYYGAEIYATAGSQHKLDYLKQLGVPYRINYQETDFEKEIMRLTNGKGVDVVINTLSGDAIQKGMNCLSSGGRYIEIAMTALKSAKNIDLSVLSNNQSFYSIDLRKMVYEDPDTFKDYWIEIIKLVEQSIIRPIVCQVFPLNEIKEAYRYMEERKNIGKIVVSIPEEYQLKDKTLVESSLGVNGKFIVSLSVQQDSIAIIGMSGRFAKSKTVNELWKHLVNGTDLIEEVSRWDLSKYYSEETSYCKHGSFLDEIDQFDPLFFKISELEATYMDPQQRIFLEESWKALEDAGYAGTGVKGCLCGVYVGCGCGDYQQLFGDDPPAQAFWGNAGSVIPARIAYYLDLLGPAVAVDTACSSSLVAIHLACQGLWTRETELALAGGVFIQSTPGFYLAANRAGMLSSTGRCHTFDERADGFVPGEGVGVVVLKRLKDAIADGDHIYGVIRGSGINQDGTTNGITAPSAKSQERLECYVYEKFNIHPEQIQMVEAHGTGTRLGDPIEFQALTRTFRKYTDRKEYCAIGSIKTNIGHAATAAGIAGLIKILLSLQHKQIPPSLHFQSGNSNIQFKDSPFYVNTSFKDWEVGPNSKRCASVSSFGFSGTNAHMIIEEAPRVERRHSEKPGFLIVLSARTFEQLRQQAEQLVEYCEKKPQVDCGNMSYTLLLGRKHFNHRLACVVRSQNELVTLLKKWLKKGKLLQIHVSQLQETEHREQPSLKRYGNQCIQNCQNANIASNYLELLATIADLYVQGYALEFEQLFLKEQYSRISLPTYPFDRQRHWVPETSNDSHILGSKDKRETFEKRNPLLHRIDPKKTAKLESGIVFETVLTPEHSSLIGHAVKGQHILPVVAYIEMIRAAMKEIEGNAPIEIEEVDCLRPLVVKDEITIYLVLRGTGKYHYTFQIQSYGSDPLVYSQGKVKVYEEMEDVYIDYKCIQKTEIPKEDMKKIYKRFSQLGIEYKGAFSSLKRMWVNEEEVLGELQLDESYQESGYSCHPGLIDSAIQSVVGLSGKKSDMDFTFSIKGVKIIGDMPLRIFSYLRRTKDGKYYQLALLDPTGKVLVQIQQLSTRKLKNAWDELMYLPIWEEQSILTSKREEQSHTVLVVYSESPWKFEQTIIDYYKKTNITKKIIQIQISNHTKQISENEWMCDINDPKGFETCLHGYGTIDCLYFISNRQGEKQSLDFNALSQSQQSNEIQLFRLIKSLKQSDTINNRIDCYIITQDNYRITDARINPYGGGITGLAYAIAQGDYRFLLRNIDVSREDLMTTHNRNTLLRLILNEEPSDRGELIKFKNGCRYKQVFLKFDVDNFKKEPRLKKGGVYVLLGGGGTVGGIITRYLMQEYNAKVVWIGRKPETSNVIQEKLESLRGLGELPLYIQADVTSYDEMKHAITHIKRHYSIINGAIFSGLVFKSENSVNRATENEFLDILNVKTKGSMNFYSVFQDESLDFMCYFSSAQAFSFSGAANLSAYASGITFSDTFVQFIQGISKFPVGIINWGFWKSSINESMEETYVTKNIGFLEDREGFDCFEHFTHLLQEGFLNQVVCLKASKPVRELINSKDEEMISICEKRSASIVRSLWNNTKIEEQKVKALSKSSGNDSEEFNEWMSKLLFVQMRQLGLFHQSAVPEEIPILQKTAGVIDKYDRWLKECLNILDTRGYVQCESGQVNVFEKPVLEDGEKVWKDWDLIKESYLKEPDKEAKVRLVDACLKKLPEILKGDILAADILFPNSSMEMVDRIYKGNALSDYFNTMVADGIEEYVSQRIRVDSQTKIRIIEIGAGTGSTSVMVFAKLKPYSEHVEYYYTDISKSFLMFAKEQYEPDNPYLVYKLWNVEKPLAVQGIEIGGYDIVIATNVMHATKNIRQTIRNAKAALKTNGILVLNEITRKSIFATLTFGLLDSWWLFEDDSLRISGSPLLYPETWQKVLEEEGFRQIHFPAEPIGNLGQHIIAAESDGLIRQIVNNDLILWEIKNDVNDANDAFVIQENPTSIQQSNKTTMLTTEISDKSAEEYIKAMIVEYLSKSLKVPQDVLDINVPFSDYGVDSIIGVIFIKKINNLLGVNMNSAILFDYTTIDRLTSHLLKTCEGQIKKSLILSSNNTSPQKVVKSIDGLFKSDLGQIEENCNHVTQKTYNDEMIELLGAKFLKGEISTEKLISIILTEM